MNKKTLSLMGIVLLASLSVVSTCFRSAKAVSPIYINADGTVSPSSVPIQNVNNTIYTFMDDISGTIFVMRSDIIIDGNGFQLFGGGEEFGFLLNATSGVVIKNVSISDFSYGVYYRYASANMLYSNNLWNNTVGIYILSSTNITIAENKIANSGLGIEFYASDLNWIERNTISQNMVGIWLNSSSYNTIVHNNFVTNSNSTVVQNPVKGSNIWSLNYPLGGNYWDTYTGVDNLSGVQQNATGADGIGDKPYFLTGTEVDLYPLMGRWGSPTYNGSNVVLFPADDIVLMFAGITLAGNTSGKINSTGPDLPYGFTIVNYYEIETSATYDGTIVVRIRYNDSGLAPDQESGLKLLQYNPLLGDLTFDGKVNIDDVMKAISGYHTSLGDPKYNPLADIAPDYGFIDIFDLVSLIYHYGDSALPAQLWSDVTTRIDTENNLIYGQVPHLSIFGVSRPS